MKQLLPGFGRMHGRNLLALLTLIVAGSVAPVGVTAASVNFEAT
jgi:hypothetical protein